MLDKELLAQIVDISRSLHRSGSMSVPALLCLARHLSAGKIERSAETGTGATTLLLSHVSHHHHVFTVNSDLSMSKVLDCSQLNRGAVTFVEGPTQRTLPVHQFDGALQAVVIDGPHAYPFPELEYFYLYPQIENGGLLVIDDIQIPTIHNIFRFLREDDMFRLVEVCNTTAFFRRTAAPVFDPLGDGWWLQKHNRQTLLRYTWRNLLKGTVPENWRERLRKRLDLIRMNRFGN